RYSTEVDLFLTPSRFAAQMHAGRGFSRPMVHLPTFVDVPTHERRESPHPRPYFLFVGRLEAVKGVSSLIEAWKRISEVDLLIAGDVTEASVLQNMAAVNPRIRFLGFMTEATLRHLYANCVACIVPSIIYEVFTTVILQAFA